MRFHQRALEALLAHARDSYPYECCGVLLARPGGQAEPNSNSPVDRLIPAENEAADDLERRYVLGHEAHIRAIALEASGAARIAGYYHSHPHGLAQPSVRDISRANDGPPELAAGIAYVIVGLAGGPPGRAGSARATAWRCSGDRMTQEPLEVEG